MTFTQSANTSYEAAFDCMHGSPKRQPALGRQPSSGNRAGDRFMPRRSAMDLDVSRDLLFHGSDAENAENGSAAGNVVTASPAKEEYNAQLSKVLGKDRAAKVLSFQEKPKAPSDEHQQSMRVLYTQNRENLAQPKKYSRHIPNAPERILDAPELLDDYYLNLLDWSSTNVLGVALGSAVYLWNANDGSIDQLMETSTPDSHVTSLSWIEQGHYMAIGTSDHKVQIWDVEKHKQLRSMDGHSQRVGALAWNGPMLSSGGRDSRIVQHDVRAQNHMTATLKGHTQEVCGLKWSANGTMLASGGNDNLLNIWDDRYLSSNNSVCEQPMHRLEAHRAAVKALAWCPWQKNLLASGGGTADRCIRFWNATTGACLNEIDTHSQVCSLQWSKHDKEIVSSHGYSHNQLILWKYPSMVKAAELTGHTARVLHMAQSPDGQTIVSAAADETLRFWKCLSGGSDSKKEKALAKESLLHAAHLTSIR